MKNIIIILIAIGIGSCTKGGKLTGVNGAIYNVTAAASSKQLIPAIDTTATAAYNGLYDETTNILTGTITWSDLWLDTKKDTITSIVFYGPATAHQWRDRAYAFIRKYKPGRQRESRSGRYYRFVRSRKK
jgi:hypothetical protein